MKPSTKFFLVIIFISITFFSIAHEYWIAPVKYRVKSKETFTINCYAGEDFKEAVWAKRKERTLRVNIYHEKEVIDITPKFTAQDSVKISMSLNETGNHLIAIKTKPSYIEM